MILILLRKATMERKMFIVDKKIRCWCPSVAFGITIILYRGNQVANGQSRRS